MKYKDLPIDSIDEVSNTKVDLDLATELADSIAELGLLQPILVRKIDDDNYELVAGRHRLKACKILKHDTIKAAILTTDDLQTELAEIDENLLRKQLSRNDRDMQMSRRKEIYEELHPSTKRGGDRRSEARKSKAQNDRLKKPSFVEDTAKKTGKSESTIKRSVARGEKLRRGEPPDPKPKAPKPDGYIRSVLSTLEKVQRELDIVIDDGLIFLPGHKANRKLIIEELYSLVDYIEALEAEPKAKAGKHAKANGKAAVQ